MNSWFVVLFFSITVALSQARYNYKDLKQEETNFLFNRAETLQKTNKQIGETKINAQFYAIETDTKWGNLKQDKGGLLMKLFRHNNGTEMKEIRVDNEKFTSTLKETTTTTTTVSPDNNDNVKKALDLNEYFLYEVESLESKRKSNENLFDYFSSQVAIFSWPVKQNDVPTCAGSVISDHYILTTANCVEDEKRVVLVCGARNIQEPEPFQVKVESSNFKIHKQWNSTILKNNIALIKLPEPLKFNEYISPVNLPTKDDENKTFTDYNATLVAWSSDHKSGVAMPINTTDVIISNVKCMFTFQSLILSSHICLAGSRSNSSCVGENGDQLIVKDDDGTVKLIGLMSFGMLNGCQRKQPVVFTRVTSYLSWIQRHADM